MEKLKRPLILWSGGFDSTCLLIYELLRGDVDVLYVTLENNSTQQSFEQKSREVIKLLLKDAFESGYLKGRIIEELFFHYGEIKTSNFYGYSQPQLWLLAASFLFDLENNSAIKIGYVRYDDVWHIKHEIVQMHNALTKLRTDNGQILLEFPFEYETKKTLYGEVMRTFKYGKHVLKKVYYCEDSSNGKACDKCTSCKRHKMELA